MSTNLHNQNGISPMATIVLLFASGLLGWLIGLVLGLTACLG